MSSFVDPQLCLIGQHIRNARDSSPGSLCGGVSKRREHDDLQQELEAEAGEEEGGMRRPVNLDLGCGSKLERSWGRRTLRQSSYTSDLDLTPSTELSSWHDLHLAAEERGWAEERTKHWTDPRPGITGFQDANPSLEANLNNYESRNKRAADVVRGGVGRGDGRYIDVGSDSDSGKGTVSDCRQSPTEEISFPERSIEETCKQSLCHQDVETTSDDGSVTIEASPASSMEQRKSKRTLDESDCLGEVPCLTDLQMIRESKLTLHNYSDYDCYPVLSQSSPGVTHPERLSKVERYLAPASPGEGQSEINRFAADKEFSGDVRIHGVPDSNNNNSFEISSPSQVDNPRCQDAVTPLCHACKVDISHEFKGTPNRTGHCKVDDGVSDADRDLVSSRRELQAKCQDMYGSRPSILGSQDIHSRLGSHQNVHDSRHDIHGSYRDIYPRHDAKNIYHDAYNNHDDIRDSHYDVYDICRDVSDSCHGADGSHDISSSGQVYHRGRGFQAGIQNNAHAMRGSLDAFPAHHEFTHASHDSIHDSRQHCIAYNRSPSLIVSPSTISTESSFGIAPGNLNSTPAGRRYFRREPLVPSGVGAPRNSPQKGHRYTRKSSDVYFVTASESDPEIFHEEFDKAFPGSHGNITPAQYRRIRSVPHDGTPAGPRVLGSTHPALQQPFSDQEAVTLPRPAKAGRSAAEQQVNSCGKTDAKGHRLRPNRRWTNLGLSSAEPEMDEFRQKTKTPTSQSGARFRFPSLFKSRKDSTSAASIGTRSGTIPGTGTPVISGSTAGNDARIRSDSETGSKARSRSGNAAESGFETGSSQGSVGDISLWSMSLGSTQSVFDSRETPLPVQGVDAGNDHFQRSISVPNPDGRVRSSASILDRIRARLSPRKKSSSSKDRLNQSDQKKSSSSKDGLAQAQNREEIQLAVLPLFNSQVTDVSRGQTDGDDETDRCAGSSMTTVAMANSSMTTTFGTSTPTNSEESAIRMVNYTDTKASSASAPATPSSSSSSSAAAAAVPQTSATLEGFPSKMRNGRMTPKRAPPSEECLNAVSHIIDALDGLTDFVNFSITSGPSTERTITEVEFKEYRSRMIDAVKDFNQACKNMVIKTPESEPAFLQALHKCLQSLDDVADNYTALVDCASLPADRSKVAIPVIAVAYSLRETVTVACRVIGCPSRDPVMLALRRSANRLVGDLALLMKSVREMNYNRLSRRF